MGRLSGLFDVKKERVLNVYCTAGFPSLDDTLPVLEALQANGADIVELGMPYSDPLADGPVIQHSSSIALANGMTIEKLFLQLEGFRKRVHIPVILMGYMNPVLQYGFEKFCADAARVGIDGLILPDLPPYEFEKTYRPILHRQGLDFIFLVTPETAAERVTKLDALSSGFLYAVSSSATTGSEGAVPVENYLQRLQAMPLKNPVLVGFGIKDKSTFDTVCRYAAGGIIGTAYIKALENNRDIHAATSQFLSSILGGKVS